MYEENVKSNDDLKHAVVVHYLKKGFRRKFQILLQVNQSFC